MYRTTMKDGIAVVSDCASTNMFRAPKYNYDRHRNFTGEYGTIIVFSPPGPQSFSSVDDMEAQKIMESYPIERFVHHFAEEELLALFKDAGFQNVRSTIEKGRSPSGKAMDAIILTAIK